MIISKKKLFLYSDDGFWNRKQAFLEQLVGNATNTITGQRKYIVCPICLTHLTVKQYIILNSFDKNGWSKATWKIHQRFEKSNFYRANNSKRTHIHRKLNI